MIDNLLCSIWRNPSGPDREDAQIIDRLFPLLFQMYNKRRLLNPRARMQKETLVSMRMYFRQQFV